MAKHSSSTHPSPKESIEAVCIYHKGSYDLLPDAYSFIMKYVEENGYEIVESPRERYIDGIWNKENIDEWVTEIQVTVRKK
ncbi:GyrI-like domain-containing protein [Clostridium tertium]